MTKHALKPNYYINFDRVNEVMAVLDMFKANSADVWWKMRLLSNPLQWLYVPHVSAHLHSPFHTHALIHTPPRDQAVYPACLCPHFSICTWRVGPLPLHGVSVGCCWICRPGWTGAPLCCRAQLLLQMLLRLCWIMHNVFWANTERYTLCKECVNIQSFHGVSSQLGGWKGNPNVLFFFFLHS